MDYHGPFCEHCGSTERLEIHHCFYEKNKKIWEYENRFLKVLCKDCHKLRTDFEFKIKEMLADFSTESLKKVIKRIGEFPYSEICSNKHNNNTE